MNPFDELAPVLGYLLFAIVVVPAWVYWEWRQSQEHRRLRQQNESTMAAFKQEIAEFDKARQAIHLVKR